MKLGYLMLFVYIVLNTRVFLLMQEFELKSLSRLSRLVYINPVGSFCLVLGILSLGGLPPLFGFATKFMALECLVSKEAFIVGGFLVVGSLLRLFFYLRIAFKRRLMFFPQHVLSMFAWRRGFKGGKGFSFYSVVLSLLVSVRLLGLRAFPVLAAFLK